MGTFWKSIGDAMHIEYKGYLSKEQWKDGIEFVDDITSWAKSYEVEAMKPSTINIGPSRALVDMLLNLVPGIMKPFAVEVITVLAGERLREAFL
jgi:hypothetical protein